MEEDFEEKRRTALRDLERNLLAERQAKYREAIESSNTEVGAILDGGGRRRLFRKQKNRCHFFVEFGESTFTIRSAHSAIFLSTIRLQ